MFKPLSEDPKNALLADRLGRLAQDLRALSLSTREEYQAEVYSRVNAILSLGAGMTALAAVAPETPAILGDVTENLERLNQDGADIASQILRIEDLAARLYNLAASSQNALRQQIRELALASNQERYLEAFINERGFSANTASVDYSAGVATLPLISEVELTPIISVGDNSVGELEAGAEFLTDDQVETALVWKGSKLELILSFAQPEIINRLKIEMDDYQGLEITSLETSPDSTHVDDILEEIGKRTLHLNGIQSKYSGDFVLDFIPKHAKSVRIMIEDRVGVEHIALRSMQVFARRYGNAGRILSKPIHAPTGKVKLTTIERRRAPLTSIVHQISYNGVNFTAVTPGSEIDLESSPFWYGVVLERSSSRFEDEDSPIEPINADPIATSMFELSRSNSVPLGDGLVERTLVFQTITGPVKFRETPLPGTLQVQEGSVLLDEDDYAFSDSILSFPEARGSITVTYQTSALGLAAIRQRESYYSPYLFEARFEKV